jgi:Flp pilus assembly protein TadG
MTDTHHRPGRDPRPGRPRAGTGGTWWLRVDRLRVDRLRVDRLRVDDGGRVTAFFVVLSTAVMLFAGLVLDGGLALAAKVRAIGAAQEAARAGAQAIDLGAYRTDGTLRLDPDRAAALARAYLADAVISRSDPTGTALSGLTVEVVVVGDTVTVTVGVSEPTQLLGLVGISSIRVSGTGSAHPDRGPDAAAPIDDDAEVTDAVGAGPDGATT